MIGSREPPMADCKPEIDCSKFLNIRELKFQMHLLCVRRPTTPPRLVEGHRRVSKIIWWGNSKQVVIANSNFGIVNPIFNTFCVLIAGTLHHHGLESAYLVLELTSHRWRMVCRLVRQIIIAATF